MIVYFETHLFHNCYALSEQVYSVLAGKDEGEAPWRHRDQERGRKEIRVLRNQKTYGVSQRGRRFVQYIIKISYVHRLIQYISHYIVPIINLI